MLCLVWCLLLVIDGHASSDWLPGLMVVKVHCVLYLGLMGVVVLCRFITLCVCAAHDVCIVLRLSLVFFVFLLYDDGKKGYCNYFITTWTSKVQDYPHFS